MKTSLSQEFAFGCSLDLVFEHSCLDRLHRYNVGILRDFAGSPYYLNFFCSLSEPHFVNNPPRVNYFSWPKESPLYACNGILKGTNEQIVFFRVCSEHVINSQRLLEKFFDFCRQLS